MIRKTLFMIAIITMVALSALVPNQPSSAAAQTPHGSQIPPSLRLDITDMELSGSTLMTVNWTANKTGSIGIQSYEITLELSRNGIKERFVQTASPTSTSVKFNLAGISADKRVRLFGPSLKATVVLKAACTVRIQGHALGRVFEAQETETFNASPIEK